MEQWWQSWAKQKGWGYWGTGLQWAAEVVMVKLLIYVIGVNSLVSFFFFFFSPNGSQNRKKPQLNTPQNKGCFRRLWHEMIARLHLFLPLDSVIRLLQFKSLPPNKHNFPNCLSFLNWTQLPLGYRHVLLLKICAIICLQNIYLLACLEMYCVAWCYGIWLPYIN